MNLDKYGKYVLINNSIIFNLFLIIGKALKNICIFYTLLSNILFIKSNKNNINKKNNKNKVYKIIYFLSINTFLCALNLLIFRIIHWKHIHFLN